MLSNRSRSVAMVAALLLCTGLWFAPAARADQGTAILGWWEATVQFITQLVLPPEEGTDPAPDPCELDPEHPDCPTSGDPGGDYGGWADPDG